MDNKFQEDLISMKHVLESELRKNHGDQIQVTVRHLNSKRLDTLVEYTLAAATPQGVASKSFEVYKDRKGVVYWSDSLGGMFREDTSERVIN